MSTVGGSLSPWPASVGVSPAEAAGASGAVELEERATIRFCISHACEPCACLARGSREGQWERSKLELGQRKHTDEKKQKTQMAHRITTSVVCAAALSGEGSNAGERALHSRSETRKGASACWETKKWCHAPSGALCRSRQERQVTR